MSKKGPKLMVSPGGEKAQVFTVQKGGVNKVAGDGALSKVSVVLCVIDGDLLITWNDTTTDTVAFLAGGVLGIEDAASVTVVGGAKFHTM